jgi:hypothetical protein
VGLAECESGTVLIPLTFIPLTVVLEIVVTKFNDACNHTGIPLREASDWKSLENYRSPRTKL